MYADEKEDLFSEYCEYLFKNCISIEDCDVGDPRNYESCSKYNKFKKKEELWKNRIPEERDLRRKI